MLSIGLARLNCAASSQKWRPLVLGHKPHQVLGYLKARKGQQFHTTIINLHLVMRHRLVSSVISWTTHSNTHPYLSCFEILFILSLSVSFLFLFFFFILHCNPPAPPPAPFGSSWQVRAVSYMFLVYWPFMVPTLSSISSPCPPVSPHFCIIFKMIGRVRHPSILILKLI